MLGQNINDLVEDIIENNISLTVGELMSKVGFERWNLTEKLIWDSVNDTVTPIWGDGVYQIIEKIKWL